MTEDSASSESLTPAKEGDVGEWLSLIDEARKDARDYHKKCERIRKKYKYESSLTTKRRRFQLLWSNIEILKPAIYAKRPSPSVSNRWKDGDAVARIASELIERNLDFQFDSMDYGQSLELLRNDYLLFARGVCRLRYEPVFKSAEVDQDDDGFSAAKPEGEGSGSDLAGGSEALDAGDGRSTAGAAQDADGPSTGDDASNEGDEETLDFENVSLDFVHLEDFIHPKARTWKELPWISFTSYMSRDALKKRFTDRGEDGKTIGECVALDVIDDGQDNVKKTSTGINPRKATVYEIWDKTRKRVVWVSPGYPEVLDQCEPYLKLEGFFPCPRPAYGTLSTDSLEPIPDFVFYQDQAEEIDQLTSRIGALADSLKLVGFYPAGPAGEGVPEIEMAVRPGFENKMIAVKSWAAFMAGGGKGGEAPIVWLPVQMVGDILKGCVELRKQLIDDVYQLTGISDIIRGVTEAEETAAAQGIKSQWGSLRLKERQNEMARLGRDVTRMAAEILANHCQVSTMVKVANMKIPTEAEQQEKIQQYQIKLRAFAIQQQMAQQQAQMRAAGASPSGQAAAPGGGPPQASPPPMAPHGPPGVQLQQHPQVSGPPQGGLSNSGVAPMQGRPQQVGAPGATSPGVVSPNAGAPAPQPGTPSAPSPQPPQPPTPVPTQEMIQKLLEDGVTRRFLIDIETDSMIASDEQAEQQSWSQFLEAVSRFLVAWLPMVEQTPELLPVASQLLLSAIRRYKVGRESEAVIEQALDKLEAKAGQPKPPSGEQLKAQADLQKAQAEIATAKIDAQSAAQKAQADIAETKLKGEVATQQAQMDMRKMQMEMQLEMAKAKMEMHGQQQKHSMDLQAAQTKAQMDQQAMQMQHQQAIASQQAQGALESQKQAGAQKTLSQQAQMDETKLAASSAMQQFKSSADTEAAKRAHDMRMEEMKTPDAGPLAAAPRKEK